MYISISSFSMVISSSLSSFPEPGLAKSNGENFFRIFLPKSTLSFEKHFALSKTSRWDLKTNPHNSGVSVKGSSLMTGKPLCAVPCKACTMVTTFSTPENFIIGPATTSPAIKCFI
uniref:Uncharacterized protein n=1 Tax=Opuntia streptacantha TaxID=393608 RepID=A0A7C9E292_OPUST